MEKSETELKKEKIELEKEDNLIDHAIGYFSKYGEPSQFSGIRKYLIEKKSKLDDRLKEINNQITRIRASK